MIAGLHRFRKEELGRYEKLFKRLSREGQNPHTLFITCCDSRVHAELITGANPGDLFIVKNIGNIVPSARSRGLNSVGAAIEFAVDTLEVADIVVCGHSRCGAITSLIDGLLRQDSTPLLKKWLKQLEPVRKLVETDYRKLDHEKKIHVAAQENVLFGLENLKSYHCINKKLVEGTLRLHGWYFMIETAEIFAYDHESQQFQEIIRD